MAIIPLLQNITSNLLTNVKSDFGSLESLIKQGVEEDTILEDQRDAKTGAIVDEPQKAVVPIFDNEVNKRILEEYVEGEKAKAPNDEVYAKVVDAMVEQGRLTEEQVAEAMGTRYSVMDTPESAEELAEIEAERKSIIETTKANGTYLKAPNGKNTNLTPEQWVDVRTSRFKKWFGDWELIAKFYPSKKIYSVDEAMESIAILFDKPLTNDAFGFTATISKNKSKKLHSGKAIKQSVNSRLHALAIANIQQLFENAEIDYTHPDTNGTKEIERVHRLGTLMFDAETNALVPVKITAFEYNTGTGNKIYSIEAIDVEEIKKPAGQLEDDSIKSPRSPIADFDTKIETLYDSAKGILENSSKIVDENGEPKVVYHQTNHSAYINRETGLNWDELDWRERMEWDEREDWDEYWEEQEFNTFSRVNARTTNEFDGFFFAPEYDEYHEYGNRTIEAFLNIENPASNGDYYIDSSKNNAGREERIRLQNEGYDGVMENFFGIMKSELRYLHQFSDMEVFKGELRKYINYHNNDCIKLKLNGKSSAQYRTLYQ